MDVWNPVIERIQRRLSRWKANYLSKRMTLLKAALANIPIYFMPLFNMPKSVAQKIEKLQREYLWKGGENPFGMHLVAWDVVAPWFQVLVDT